MADYTPPFPLERIVATDCGSTTTKAVLFQKTVRGWRQTHRGEAPTTVERPVQDVTIGVRNAFRELEELSGIRILNPEWAEDSTSSPLLIRKSADEPAGVDLYVSTSSAGGGLQMIVMGIVASMSTSSAERAALGAGAIVMDRFSFDDGREPYERIQKIRHLRPDIILLSGGTDGGVENLPLELAELILQADPRPRFGDTLRLPVIIAANSKVHGQLKELLDHRCSAHVVENVRPALERENLKPSRDEIHELFLHHVMSHAPGYGKLLSWSPVPVIPTPSGFGEMVQTAARHLKKNILAVDIGGATTDVFSVVAGADGAEAAYNRTVSANLGMSYSVANVLAEAGPEKIGRWLPFELSLDELSDSLRNKMVRPTTIPQSVEDLILEQAVCREALSLAYDHHKRLSTGLQGAKQKAKGFTSLFSSEPGRSPADIRNIDMIIGSGGVLSHAPDRSSAALMLIDAFEPSGLTELAVDSIFMMPHLGVLSTVDADAAVTVFLRDCLVPLGSVLAPRGSFKAGAPCMKIEGLFETAVVARWGELHLFPISEKKTVSLKVTPIGSSVDVGKGRGVSVEYSVRGGVSGIFIDCRGRPLVFPHHQNDRIATVRRWFSQFRLQTASISQEQEAANQ